MRLHLLPWGLAALLFSACGGSDESASNAPTDDAAASEQATAAKETEDGVIAPQDYYEQKYNLPPDVVEALESGQITQEEVDQRAEAGEFEKFFVFATPEDIPADLEWENGMDLPDIGSSKAKKGGTLYGRIQDYPRTLRRYGPDANSSFRGYLLDEVELSFATRHPNETEVTDTGFRYFPQLAKEWAVDRENKTVYVRLDPAARWSDGEAVTSDDVLYMFYFFHSPHIRAPWYNNWYNRMYSQVTRYDEHTFSVKVPEAKPDMKGRVLGLVALPEHFYGTLNPDFTSDFNWKFQPTTGAYIIRENDMQKGRFVILTRQKDWWAKDKKFLRNRFNFDRINLTVIRDTAKAFESFRKGDLDGFGLNLAEYWYDKLPNDAPLVENGYVHKYVFYNDVPRPTYGLWINKSKPLLDNRDVRVGLNYATNFERVIDGYFRGDASRMRTSADGYGPFSHPDLKARPFDIEKALDHFEKAGFTQYGEDGILRNAQGQRLSFTVTTGYEFFQDLLVILKEEARKAGVEFRLEVLDGNTAWKKIQEKQHDIAFSAFGVGPELYPRYWETYHSVNAYDRAFTEDGKVNPDRQVKTQTNNLQVIAIPELDKLIERYRASEDIDEMQDLAHQMEEILYEDASFVPGWVQPYFRWAAWRWMQYPEDGNVRIAGGPGEWFLAWIEPGAREETKEAMRKGETFEKVIKVFDQYKAD